MFLDLRGQRVHSMVHGSGSPTLIGLPGIFGDVELWQQPFEVLHHRFRTVTYDHFGTGLTYVPEDLVTFEEQVCLLEEVLEYFGPAPCVVLGESSTTAVAITAAARWPDRVVGLVLVAGRADHTPDERTTEFVSYLRGAFAPTVERFVELCLPEDDEGHLRRWLVQIITRTGPERCARLVESFYDVTITNELTRLVCPVLQVHGDADVINPLAEVDATTAAVPSAELAVLPGVGHVPTLSRPQQVAALIEDFVDSLPA